MAIGTYPVTASKSAEAQHNFTSEWVTYTGTPVNLPDGGLVYLDSGAIEAELHSQGTTYEAQARVVVVQKNPETGSTLRTVELARAKQKPPKAQYTNETAHGTGGLYLQGDSFSYDIEIQVRSSNDEDMKIRNAYGMIEARRVL